MKWFAQAPSNIALIKYMGKNDAKRNIPYNSSLSYTLEDLQSFVEIESHNGTDDFWEPLEVPAAHPFDLHEKAQARFLAFFAQLKKHFQYEGGFTVRSYNNFPTSAGLASSASSFAALTKATARAMIDLKKIPEPSMTELAQLSQQGSGSSCRSFFAPWCIWNESGIQSVELPYEKLIHQAIIVDHEEKEIPSSEAHQLVRTSPLYEKRKQHTESRLKELTLALQNQDWQTARTLVWQEFMEMHEMFATCDTPFAYITERTQQVLDYFHDYWQQHNDGPLITMDAGPNVHLLYRADQNAMALEIKQKLLNDYDVI